MYVLYGQSLESSSTYYHDHFPYSHVQPLYMRLMGYFHNTIEWSGGASCAALDRKNYWTDLQNSNGVRLLKIYSKKIVDLGVADDATGQVKIKMFDDSSCWALSRTMTVSKGKKSINQHGSCLRHL